MLLHDEESVLVDDLSPPPSAPTICRCLSKDYLRTLVCGVCMICAVFDDLDLVTRVVGRSILRVGQR